MDYLLKRVISELVLPPFGPIVLMWGGIVLRRHWPRLGRGIVCTAMLTLYLCSLSGTHTLLRMSRANNLRIAPPYPAAEAIVVLGGGRYLNAPEYGGETVSGSTLERLRYAAKLWRSSGRPILVSGGRPNQFGLRSEADMMREVLEQEFNVPVTWVESDSKNTRTNVANSTKILRQANVTRVFLVTDGYHIERALSAFEGSGIEPIPMPTGDASPDSLTLLSWIPTFRGLSQNRVWIYERLAGLYRR